MKRFLLQLVVVIGAGLVLAQFTPWWGIAIAGCVGGYSLYGHRGRSFLAAFLGALLLWACTAMYLSWSTGSALPDMFAKLLPIPLNGTGLAFVAGIIGGVVAGLGALTGESLRRLTAK